MKFSRIMPLITALGALLLLSVVGAIQAQDTVTMNVTWWGSQSRHDRTIEVIELFEEQNPNINIEYEFSGWSDYWTRVSTQAAGDNIACVMQQDYAYLTEWATRDLLMPLDDLVESGAIDVSNIDQGILDSGMVDGELYGISLGTNSQAYILDVDAFEAAGVELPAKDWTWDDFEEIANQIYEATGVWGIAYGPWDDANLKTLLISSGQNMFTEDGTAIGVEDPTPIIEHLNRFARLMESGAVPSMDQQADVSAPGLEGSPIVEGTEAIRYQWSNQVVALYTAAGEDRNFVLYPVPRVADGVTPNFLKPSMFFSITEGCETVEEAAMFIDFVTNSTEANDILLGERGVPVSNEIRDYLAEKVDPANRQVFNFIAEISEIAQPVPPPDPVGYSDVLNNVLTPLVVEPVLFGMVSAEEAYEILVSEANAILGQNAQ
jgi:multiple sugar transport system substrate-binding protein